MRFFKVVVVIIEYEREKVDSLRELRGLYPLKKPADSETIGRDNFLKVDDLDNRREQNTGISVFSHSLTCGMYHAKENPDHAYSVV